MAEAFVEESNNRVAFCRGLLNHSLEQLNDEDVWWSPADDCNSIGVIVQHLLGNLGQWILSGIGGAPDTRDRPSEFRDQNKTPRAILQAQLNKMLDQVVETHSTVSAAQLLETRTIQGYTRSVLRAMYGTMAHLEQHSGQILYLTKLRQGESYRPRPKPQGETDY